MNSLRKKGGIRQANKTVTTRRKTTQKNGKAYLSSGADVGWGVGGKFTRPFDTFCTDKEGYISLNT